MSIIYNTCPDSKLGIEKLSSVIQNQIMTGKKVLWLLPGGSGIPAAVSVINLLKEKNSQKILRNITVSLTDERYGAVGHTDSNWQQLIDAGFDFSLVNTIPVLIGSVGDLKLLDETVSNWQQHIEQAFNEHNIIIGMFGMGADGHIAGILPQTSAVESKDLVCGYVSEKFTRITLTPLALRKCDQAYLFAFGESKKKQLENLRDKKTALTDQPVQILKEISSVNVYTDCL